MDKKSVTLRERGLRLYPNVDVVLTYQNFGSSWLGILRGSSDNIELVFNGLFNLCATNGDVSYQDHAKCVAVFWSDRRGMRRFFFNQHFLPRFKLGESNGQLKRQAMRYAHTQLEALTNFGHESFMDFDNQFTLEPYSCGSITAERPDEDMKDAILAHAFTEKESKRTIDNPERP